MFARLLFALLVTLSASAHAGYYAYLISSTGAAQSLGGFQANAVSGCASSVLEAIQGVVDPTPPTTDRIVYLYSVGGGSFSGAIGPNAAIDQYSYRIAGYYATCTDVSTGGIPARLSPGLSDPTPSGPGTGTGVSQATFDQLRATVTALQASVTVLQSSAGSSGQFDYAAAGLLFSFFFSFTVAVWVVSKNLGVILEAIRRW